MKKERKKPGHDYHILDPSPWPFISSAGVLFLGFGIVAWMRHLQGDRLDLFGVDLSSPLFLLFGLLIILTAIFFWWADVIREGKEGHHTPVVSLHLRYGFILFIMSEVMFFVAWFWAFFDVSLFPYDISQPLRSEFTGGIWPPKGIQTLDPFYLPLYNTIILLLSGSTLTWAHHCMIHNDRKGLIQGLSVTVALGMFFLFVQFFEYQHAPFAFQDSIYGATFFMATGFHGVHVFIGTVFLLVCLIRSIKGDFTPRQHFSLEAAAWYWHFVDVIWLFLFASVYVWAASGISSSALTSH